jgi:hypothetical protein
VSEAVEAVVVARQDTAMVAPETEAERLIRAAIEKQVPVDTMERLLVMRRELKAEHAREAFFRSLMEFQGKCPVIPKTKTADTGTYKYDYAPLDKIVEAVKPHLQACGLSYTVQTRHEPDSMVAICTVHHVGGHSESSEFRAPIERTARMNDMQKAASAQTYAKRYAFCNALGILTGDDDDDAQSASVTPGARQGETSPSATGGTTDLRDIPCASCGQKALIKGKEQYGGGWVCFKKKGGCGQKFNEDPASWGKEDNLPDWAGGALDKLVDAEARNAAAKSAADPGNAFGFVEQAEMSSSRADILLKSIAGAVRDVSKDALKKVISEANADKNGGVLLPSDWERVKASITKAKEIVK